MDPIDYIIYTATTTDDLGNVSTIQAQYFVPFFDFLMIAIVFSFTIFFLWFFKDLMFPKKGIIVKKLAIHIRKQVAKYKDIWN